MLPTLFYCPTSISSLERFWAGLNEFGVQKELSLSRLRIPEVPPIRMDSTSYFFLV